MESEVHEHKKVFQTAGWMWLFYLGSLLIIDIFIYANRSFTPLLGYHLINGLPAFVFLGISYSPWIKRRAKIVAPLLILLVTLAPVLLNHVFSLRLPPAPLSNLEGMVLRQLPVLFIGLILVAWHYELSIMLLYSLGVNLLELAVVSRLGLMDPERMFAFYFIILIRTVCFIVVGISINKLITRLRLQQESLKTANARLIHHASTLESLTVSRERNRISRELHDTVVHTLSGLSVQLETAKAYWEVDPNTARTLLDQSLEATRSGLQETRRAIKSLRASPLDDLGLTRAIQNLIEGVSQRGQLLIDANLPRQDLLFAPDVEQCVYRIAQEALENVIHHANAHHVVVNLALLESDLNLLIEDDGCGFNPHTPLPGGHFGLAGMRERAQLVGGELSITSRPGHGTSIELVIKGSVE